MFSTLEAAWDRSARRGLSTLASFIFQGLALSLLFAIPLIWVEGPPRFHLAEILTPPPAQAPQPPAALGEHQTRSGSQIAGDHVLAPPVIPHTISMAPDNPIPSAPDLGSGVVGSTATGIRNGFFDGTGRSFLTVVPPPRPAPVPPHPLVISHMAEGSVIYRVQPKYPEMARAAHIQGAVRLRAIISKAGTIENLTAESGHPTLIRPACKRSSSGAIAPTC